MNRVELIETVHEPAARMAKFQRCRVARPLLTGFASVAFACAHAVPTGGEVNAGSGTISQSASAVTIEQSSARLSIDWQAFSIGAGEAVVFRQPSAQAIALNRVLGQDPSVILGNLSANGQVFLLNPNGVLFGAGARVDVGGIVASTLGLADEDFFTDRFTLSGNGSNAGASVVNQGTIEAADGGYVALIGSQVANEGVIRAHLGTVTLGAGEQIKLTIDGQQLVGFSVDQAAMNALAANKHLIRADGGVVILSAHAKDALLSTVVNNDGVVEARSVSTTNGVIRLEGGPSGVVSVGGTLDASGANNHEHGGRIEATGDKVALLDDAVIDASGSSGGGTILVGGDYQGHNPQFQNATRTFVAPSATIRADATGTGDGGTVIVWADDDTRFHGTVSATGGIGGGDGGFVEVSGKQRLAFQGRVDTSAALGVIGELLLDPDDLYIAAGAVGGAVADGTNPFQAIDGANDYFVLASTLAALPVATSVQLQANNNIVFQTSLAMPTTAAGSLAMTAANGIQMAGFDLSTGNGGVSMTAGSGGIADLGTINLGTGVLTLNSSGAITQNAGDVIQGATAVVKQGTGSLTLSGANTYTGATTISAGLVSATNATALGATAGSTAVAAGATLNIEGVAVGTEALTINGSGVGGNGAVTGTGTASLSGPVAMASGSTLGVAAGSDSLTLLGVVSGGSALSKVGTGTLILSGTNTYTGATALTAGTLAATANNALGTNATGTTVASGATLELRNVTYSTTEAITLNGGELAMSTGTSSLAGAVTLGANSSVNVAGAQLTLSGGDQRRHLRHRQARGRHVDAVGCQQLHRHN